MQTFLQPTLLFLTSLAHQSMSGAPAAMYQQPYGGMVAATSAFHPSRAYAPAFYAGGGRLSYRRPLRLRQPAFHYEQPQAYFRPSGRPLYDPAAISPYAYYGQQAQAPQILVLTPEQAQQALLPALQSQQQQHKQQIYFYLQPQAITQPQAYVHQPQAYVHQPQAQAQPQAYVHQPQTTQNQVVSRAVPAPHSQLITHHQSPMLTHHQHHQQAPDTNTFTVGSSYSFQNQEMGKQINHGKK